MDRITIRRPDDFHCHLRDGALLRAVAPYTARHFARALVMPNVPAIEDADDVDCYRTRIVHALADAGRRDMAWEFEPLMTVKLTPRTTRDTIKAVYKREVMFAKLYPSGVTTGSHDGITDVEVLYPVFREMQALGMVLCIHGEQPDSFILDRERDYLPTVAKIIKNFPGLRVVLEHITTAEAVEFVKEASVNVAATITAHHLKLLLDDILGGGLHPHNFCYPVPKTPHDRSALVHSAFYDNNKFFFGSDSAPHVRSAKESACGCAGVFSAPVALATLAEFFIEGSVTYVRGVCEDFRRSFENFTSRFGAEFYGLPPNEGIITLERRPWRVPDAIPVPGTEDVIVPWRAGEELAWQVVEGG